MGVLRFNGRATRLALCVVLRLRKLQFVLDGVSRVQL